MTRRSLQSWVDDDIHVVRSRVSPETLVLLYIVQYSPFLHIVIRLSSDARALSFSSDKIHITAYIKPQDKRLQTGGVNAHKQHPHTLSVDII